jgi:hypothetical protein
MLGPTPVYVSLTPPPPHTHTHTHTLRVVHCAYVILLDVAVHPVERVGHGPDQRQGGSEQEGQGGDSRQAAAAHGPTPQRYDNPSEVDDCS